MTHEDLIGAWAQFFVNEGADFFLLMDPNEESYFSIPADKALVFVSSKKVDPYFYADIGLKRGVSRVLLIQGAPDNCIKTLIHLKRGA